MRTLAIAVTVLEGAVRCAGLRHNTRRVRVELGLGYYCIHAMLGNWWRMNSLHIERDPFRLLGRKSSHGFGLFPGLFPSSGQLAQEV